MRRARSVHSEIPGHVVYVHGLWMSGGECLVLRHRLEREFGFHVHRFRYSTVSGSMAEVVASLRAFVRDLHVPRVHFVGHSLGGLVIYRFLERYPRQPVGRVVFLGTPCKPSRTAQAANRRSLLVRKLMRRSAAEELLRQRDRHWTRGDLGIIAGTQGVGFGRFLAEFTEDSDGTVAVSETELPGATSHIELPVSHMGMLVSARVAREIGLFLCQGHFSR